MGFFSQFYTPEIWTLGKLPATPPEYSVGPRAGLDPFNKFSCLERNPGWSAIPSNGQQVVEMGHWTVLGVDGQASSHFASLCLSMQAIRVCGWIASSSFSDVSLEDNVFIVNGWLSQGTESPSWLADLPRVRQFSHFRIFLGLTNGYSTRLFPTNLRLAFCTHPTNLMSNSLPSVPRDMRKSWLHIQNFVWIRKTN